MLVFDHKITAFVEKAVYFNRFPSSQRLTLLNFVFLDVKRCLRRQIVPYRDFKRLNGADSYSPIARTE
jgi:hypothetical protein